MEAIPETKPMKSLRAAIIGTGSFSASHAAALAVSPDITLAGACDIDSVRLAAFGKAWKCAGYATWEELLEHESPDIVTIATPDETHARMIKDVASHTHAPRLIIVEKPLCMSQEELHDLEAFMPTVKTMIVVEHSRRFNTGFMELRTLIESGELGTFTGALWHYYAGWFHVGVHAVDTLRMLLGELQCVSAIKQKVDRYEQDPLLRAALKSVQFPEAEIILEGIPEHPYKIFEAELRFSKGRIRIQWENIAIDRATEDTYAPALFQSETRKAEPIEKALGRLYTMSSDVLNSNTTELLEIAGFAAARGTMEILFEARRLASL